MYKDIFVNDHGYQAMWCEDEGIIVACISTIRLIFMHITTKHISLHKCISFHK